MFIDRLAIENMEHLYRVAFVNSLSGFKSANLLGTVDHSGQTNLSVVSSCVHIGAHPPLLSMIIRPHSVGRHSLENILEVGEYTLNHIHQDIYRQAHQTSARYPKEVSEFEATGLTECWQDGWKAPYVREANIRLGLKFREHHHLAINGTELIIGEIMQVLVPDDCVREDGMVDIEKAGTLALSGLDRYHRSEHLARLSYAKPDRPLREI
ncbi:flavin oxidoreductase [Hahella sp. CCB-MM4]|uniref:flavin reductase family protein n=1 Tax=Hahella sp. (strain CCB-MM4) TaxID=1926491 RepID=UPI000B9A7BE7|nr:flavin reductase [Hahella sp. CCB-MM4]OZG74685.1 flavin oxidoreductase [Hahella sp. CCB-MM4]